MVGILSPSTPKMSLGMNDDDDNDDDDDELSMEDGMVAIASALGLGRGFQSACVGVCEKREGEDGTVGDGMIWTTRP